MNELQAIGLTIIFVLIGLYAISKSNDKKSPKPQKGYRVVASGQDRILVEKVIAKYKKHPAVNYDLNKRVSLIRVYPHLTIASGTGGEAWGLWSKDNREIKLSARMIADARKYDNTVDRVGNTLLHELGHAVYGADESKAETYADLIMKETYKY